MNDHFDLGRMLQAHFAAMADTTSPPSQLDAVLTRSAHTRQRPARLGWWARIAAVGPLASPAVRRSTFVVVMALLALALGAILVGSQLLRPSPIPLIPPDRGVFTPAGSMYDERDGHDASDYTVTVLDDGRVLVVGGDSGGNRLSAAELWDPVTESFASTGSLHEARKSHTATLLADGRVLVIGGRGYDSNGGDGTALATTEIWDPATGTFSPSGFLAEARWGHQATRLRDGRVLVVGGRGYDSNGGDGVGVDGSPPLDTSEIWDPATGTFSPSGSLADARSGHTAMLLHDGRVLVVGGWDGRFPIQRAEAWDPRTAVFTPTGSVALRRPYTATLLPDDRVLLIVGGSDEDLVLIQTAEVWDPTTGAASPAGVLLEPRQGYTATLLADGRVLVVGGLAANVAGRIPTLASAELWDPATDSFSRTGSLDEARKNHTATLLLDGRVLIVGNGSGGSAELFQLD